MGGMVLSFRVLKDSKEISTRIYTVLALEDNKLQLLWDNPPIEGGFAFVRDQPQRMARAARR